MHAARLLCVVLLVTSCSAVSLATPAPATSAPSDCSPGPTGPLVRYGSLNLAPTVGVVNANQPVMKALWIDHAGAAVIHLDAVVAIGEIFEICVATDPRVPATKLGAKVKFRLIDPDPTTGAVGGVSGVPFWNDLFQSFFVVPLQDTPTDANGVLKLDVQALQIRTKMQFSPGAPPGYSSGRASITILLSDGPHELIIGISLL